LEADEALYAKTLKGDRAALEILVERYHPQLFKFLYRMTGLEQTAEDLAQESFIRLITYRGEPPRRFKYWAFTLAANLARDHFRSAAYQREEGLDTFETSLGADEGVEKAVLQSVNHQQAAQLLRSLPEEFREILVLRFYHDLKLEEIAEILSIPLSTVKTRLYRALKMARQKLACEEELLYD
jgi:RNA polymerase sigma-70 factor, ECF subfamily